MDNEFRNNAQEFQEMLPCDSIVIENPKNISEVMAEYKKLLKQGKADGFIPIIIVPSDSMLEIFEFASSDEESGLSPTAIIEKANKLDAESILEKRRQEAWPDEHDNHDIMGELKKSEPIKNFYCPVNHPSNLPYPQLVVAKIPTEKPWEAAAWIPLGGYNECPAPEEQVAVYRHWFEKYGAIPAAASYDIWELYVEQPVKSEAEAQALALEQCSFCPDIIWQGMGSINALAGSLIDSTVWFFWWD
ncbi:MAG: DUF4253 domain-containing protein [Clostridiales bacterium]|jgi:hypothetical protein|nr:DUF4253 domain-containing protein [Clostridiales bacterium]